MGKIKQILMACGSGICTSTAVRQKVEKFLDDNGYKGTYEVTQCKVAEAPAKSSNFDFLIATTMAPQNLKCPYVNGVPFLMGVGMEAPEAEILRLMKEE
jgi:PTS system galactitol-specific IIB component